MLKAAAATARTTVRESVRSGFLLALTAMAAVLAFALPRMLSGDGTAEGFARTAVLYSISFSLAAICLWAVAASVFALSSERSGSTLQLAMVKPAPLFSIFLGKWFGLVLLFAFPVFIAVAGTLLAVRPAMPSGYGFGKHAPILRPVEDIAKEYLSSAREKGLSRKELKELEREALRRLPYASTILEPGGKLYWRFEIPGGLGCLAAPRLRFSCETDPFAKKLPKLDCTLADEGGERLCAFAVEDFSVKVHDIPLDFGGAKHPGKVTLVFSLSGEKDASPLIFQPRQSVHILDPQCSFWENGLRAFFASLCLVALLLAIGIAAGALLSPAVALFVFSGTVLSFAVSAYALSDPAILEIEPEGMGAAAIFAERVSAGIASALGRAVSFALPVSPAERLSRSECIAAGELARLFISCGIVLPLALFAFGSHALGKREVSQS